MVSRIPLTTSSTCLARGFTALWNCHGNAFSSPRAPKHPRQHHSTSTDLPHSKPKLTISIQVRYAATAIEPGKSARARGAYLRVSFKNTRETAQAINGWKLQRALSYLGNVIDHKEAVPMRRYAGSTGRTAQGELSCVSMVWCGVGWM